MAEVKHLQDALAWALQFGKQNTLMRLGGLGQSVLRRHTLWNWNALVQFGTLVRMGFTILFTTLQERGMSENTFWKITERKDHLYVRPDRKRQCRACQRENWRRWHQNRAAA